jgi:enterochelin esterase family protein
MHVYTPPGYEKGQGEYPVFYLLHGSGDDDAGWSTIGRAGFILDNLIADKKVPAMVAISIANGSGDAQGSQRGLEYDTMSGAYAEFVEAEVLPLVEDGAVTVPVDRTFPLAEVAQAYDAFAEGGKVGKIVLLAG